MTSCSRLCAALACIRCAAALSLASTFKILEHPGGRAAQSEMESSGVPTIGVEDTWADLRYGGRSLNRAVEAVDGVDGAFVVRDVLARDECARLVAAAEGSGCFATFDAGKNHHAALQVACRPDGAFIDELSARIAPHVPRARDGFRFADKVNARLRFYRYAGDGVETFRPHVDAGFPGGGWVDDACAYDAYDGAYASRYTVLLYLSDDFEGGETKFYAGAKLEDLVASVAPVAGSALLFPQAVGDEAMAEARKAWPFHEGSAARGGAKYVIRTDALFHGEATPFDPVDPHVAAVTEAFAPRAYVDRTFLDAARRAYSVHMGVENAAPLLYDLARFVKPRRVLEVGAGYTSLWLLKALADNDAELARIRELQRGGEAELLHWPWTVGDYVEGHDAVPARLVCIDDCAHQSEAASSIPAIAGELGLAEYFSFAKGDAWLMDDLYEGGSFDLFWLDFGVGTRVAEYVAKIWPAIEPGGYLVCHSTITNENTRLWLDAVRRREPKEATGIDPDHVTHVSLLEPHKRFQNALTILQKRPPGFAEPLYSVQA